jgi:hypothetical protein
VPSVLYTYIMTLAVWQSGFELLCLFGSLGLELVFWAFFLFGFYLSMQSSSYSDGFSGVCLIAVLASGFFI